MKKNFFVIPLMLFMFCAVSPIEKSVSKDDSDLLKNNLESFQSVMTIPGQNIKVPTVIEIPIFFEKEVLNSVLIMDGSDDSVVPSLVLSKSEDKKVSFSSKYELKLVDGSLSTYEEFPVSESGQINEVFINVSASEEITTSSLTFNLDRYVALPKSIQISTYDKEGQVEKIILAKTSMRSSTVNFPKISGKNFKIELEYSQPLRIREISFNPTNLQQSSNFVRFLAQPNKSYKIYCPHHESKTLDFSPVTLVLVHEVI